MAPIINAPNQGFLALQIDQMEPEAPPLQEELPVEPVLREIVVLIREENGVAPIIHNLRNSIFSDFLQNNPESDEDLQGSSDDEELNLRHAIPNRGNEAFEDVPEALPCTLNCMDRLTCGHVIRLYPNSDDRLSVYYGSLAVSTLLLIFLIGMGAMAIALHFTPPKDIS